MPILQQPLISMFTRTWNRRKSASPRSSSLLENREEQMKAEYNVRYIEKNFSVCPNKEVIEKVRTRVNIYEESIRSHNEMIQMTAIKDSIANSLFKEANELKKKINQK